MSSGAIRWSIRLLVGLVGVGIGWSVTRGRLATEDVETASGSEIQRPFPAEETQMPDPEDGLAAETPGRLRTSCGQMMQRLPGAKAEDFPALWDEFVAKPDSEINETGFRWSSLSSREWLMQRWVAVDPEGAFAHVVALGSEGAPMARRSIESCMRYWPKTDPQAALAKMKSAEWQSHEYSEKHTIRLLAEHDPLLALQHYHASENPGSRAYSSAASGSFSAHSSMPALRERTS